MPTRPTQREAFEYALGELSGTVRSLSEEHARTRDTVASIPDRIMVSLQGPLTALQKTQEDHAKRISNLERFRWVAEGGKGLIVFIGAAVVIPLWPLIMPHIGASK